MTKDEIKKVLDEHRKWLHSDGGKRANLGSADLRYADLSSANLGSANLRSANLGSADLRSANLGSADLRYANLRSANLGSADLRSANLGSADLRYADLSSANLGSANLRYADLRSANLGSANLRYADLSYADLRYAENIEFIKLPSIKMLASFDLGTLSDNLTLELMRRDAWAHPNPGAFDVWAKWGSCPYQNEDRFWIFSLRRDLWQPGPPQMRDSDLILAICRECGWKVRGYID